MTKIFFVRHGKVHNKNNIFYGRLPRMSISNLGKKQIEMSSKFFSNIEIKRIYSSELLRAKQSADIIADNINCHNISRSKLILEIDSYMEGEPFEFGRLSRFDHYFSSLRKPTNESMEEVLERMLKFLKKIVSKYSGDNVIAIGHGDPLMILKAHLNGLPMVLDSIRVGADNYVKYGEVLCVSVRNCNYSIKSVYCPR